MLFLTAMATISAQSPEYLCELRNDTRIDANTYEFDVYLLRTGTTAMEYAGMEFGINVNPVLRNGGLITVSYISGTSDLLSAQIPADEDLSFNNAANCIEWSGTAHPGAGSGTIVSYVTPGTRIGRFRLSNSVPFASVTPDLSWNFLPETGRVTTVNAYVGALDSDITVQTSHTTLNLSNPCLNVPAQPEEITGPSMPCPGTEGLIYEVSEVQGADSYTWSIGSGSITSGQGSRTITVTAGTSDANLVVYASNSCGDGPTRNRWLVLGTGSTAPGAVTITNDNTCYGTEKTLTVSGGSLGTDAEWEWFTGSCGGISAGTGASITVNPAAGTNTTYYVRAAGACNTTECASGMVTVPANVGIPTVPVPSAATICQGTPTITVTTSATNATSYNWTVTGAGYTVTGTGTTATVVFSSSFSGIATISVSANGCGGPAGLVTADVTVRPTPTASISGTTSVCQGAAAPSITFTNPQPFPVTVTYNIGGANEANINIDASSSTTLTVPTTSSGLYTYNLVSVTYQTAPFCTNSISGSAIVTVNALPSTSTITGDGTPVCSSTGNVYYVTANAGSSYEWTVPEGSTITSGTGTNSITVSFGTTNGNISVTEKNAAGCEGGARNLNVTLLGCGLDADFTADKQTVCVGDVVIFSNTSDGTTGDTEFLWNFGEGAVPASATTPGTHSVTYSTGGTKTVTLTITDGAVSTETKPNYITVNPLPVAAGTITGTPSVCQGRSDVSYTVPAITGATSYSWAYSGQGATINGTTNAVTIDFSVTATSGTLTVRGINSCGNGSLSAGYPITVNPLPFAPTVGTVTQPSCTVATGSVVLSGLPAGNWTVNPGGIKGSTSTVTVSGLTQGTHSFTVTNSNGCTSEESAAVSINEQPAIPTAPVMGTVTQPTCAVTTGSVGISGLPPTGTWTLTRNTDGDKVSGIGTTYTLTDIPEGTYNYTVTNEAGCVSPASEPVMVNGPLPVPAVPAQTVDCSEGAGSAVVTVTYPVGTDYQYSLDDGLFQTSNIFDPVSNGDHTITVRNASNCTTKGPIFPVACNCGNPATVTLSASSGSTCGVTTVTVSGNTFGGGATRVTISDNGGGTVTPPSSITSPFYFTYTPVAADAGQVVIITVTTDDPDEAVCTAASATYNLTVNANPVAPVRGTITHPTCALPTGSVVLNSLPPTGNWTITRSPGGQTTSGSGTSTTITGLAPGTYNFTVTNAPGCVSPVSADVVINVQPDTPTAPVVGEITQPTCALSTGSVALSGLPAAGNWTLTRTPGNVTINGSGATRTVSSIPPGTYTFTVANAAGCVSPASAEVVINMQPVTPVAPAIGTITHPTCDLATGTVVLENMPENGEWTLIRYPGGSATDGSGTSTTISSLPAGIYNFTVRNTDGCTSPVSANAVINAQPPTPTAPVVGSVTHPTFQVATGSVVLSGLPASGTWTLIRYPDGFTSQGTGTTRTVSGLEPGTYTFAVTNSFGCTSISTGNVVINARPGAPVVVINNPPTICENETTDLTAPAITAGSDANLTFTYWTDSEATVEYTTPSTAPAGTYYIMGTSTAGYYTIKSVMVTADQLPIADAGPDQVLDYLFGTALNADIPEMGTGLWVLVSGTGDIFNSAAPSTSVSGLSVGENIFSWTVTNGACDPVSDQMVVKVNNLNIPTLITPNEDGLNDFFKIRGLETLGRTELTIFDRRGMKVYENNDYSNEQGDRWEGLDYNSNPLPDDTYFYVIRAVNGVSISGYIVVRR